MIKGTKWINNLKHLFVITNLIYEEQELIEELTHGKFEGYFHKLEDILRVNGEHELANMLTGKELI